MKSQRLTTRMRDEIERRVMAARYDERKKAIKRAKGALAEAIYAHLVPEPVQQQMAALPDGWFVTCADMRVRVRKHSCYTMTLKLPAAKDMPACFRGECLSEDEIGKKLFAQAVAIAREEEEVEEEWLRDRGELAAALAQFRTTKQLVEACPEVVEICPEIAEEAPMLPVSTKALKALVVSAVKAVDRG